MYSVYCYPFGSSACLLFNLGLETYADLLNNRSKQQNVWISYKYVVLDPCFVEGVIGAIRLRSIEFPLCFFDILSKHSLEITPKQENRTRGTPGEDNIGPGVPPPEVPKKRSQTKRATAGTIQANGFKR